MGKPSESWYVRASQVGALMSKGTKGESFGLTAMSVITDAVWLNKHGVTNDIPQNKFLQKGIIMEPESIKMMMNEKKWKAQEKDGHLKKRRFFNDYVTGEPDLYFMEKNSSSMVLGDVKSSFSLGTFTKPQNYKGPLKTLNKSYWYQMLMYMWLCGDVKKSFLAYCLTDTPDHIIEGQVYSQTMSEMKAPENYDKDMTELEDEIRERVKKGMIFSHVPEKSRIKIFEIDIEMDEIEKVKARIIEAKEIYDKIYKTI